MRTTIARANEVRPIAKIKPRYTSICDLSYTKEMIIDYLEALKTRTDTEALFVPPPISSSEDSGGLTSSSDEECENKECKDQKKAKPPKEEQEAKDKKNSPGKRKQLMRDSMINLFDQQNLGNEAKKDPRLIK